MNTIITFPPAMPTLKLAPRGASNPPSEKWAATLTEERRRLQEDHEALREREANLRDYEARLRSLQAEIEAGHGAPPVTTRTTLAPFARPATSIHATEDGALQSAWEKLQRSRDLFAADQAHLRDERIVLQDQKSEVKRREEIVAAREARVAEREQLVAAASAPVPSAEPIAGEHTISAMTKLTRAPFDMARSVFGGKK